MKLLIIVGFVVIVIYTTLIVKYVQAVAKEVVQKEYSHVYTHIMDVVSDLIVANNEKIEEDLINLGVLPKRKEE